MLHFSLSLLKRLNKTKSAIFISLFLFSCSRGNDFYLNIFCSNMNNFAIFIKTLSIDNQSSRSNYTNFKFSSYWSEKVCLRTHQPTYRRMRRHVQSNIPPLLRRGHKLKWKSKRKSRIYYEKSGQYALIERFIWLDWPNISVIWEHDLNPWDWEFQRCFVKIWEEMHDSNFTVD